MANDEQTGSKTVICVGDRVRIECGDHAVANPGRLWRVLFDGEEVKGVCDVYLFGPTNDLGRRSIAFDVAEDRRGGALEVGTFEPPADLIAELRRAGWAVGISKHGKPLGADVKLAGITDTELADTEVHLPLRAVVLDADGREVDYAEGAHALEAVQAAAEQAAHAAFWWYSGDTRREQEKAGS